MNEHILDLLIIKYIFGLTVKNLLIQVAQNDEWSHHCGYLGH